MADQSFLLADVHAEDAQGSKAAVSEEAKNGMTGYPGGPRWGKDYYMAEQFD